MCSIHVSIYSSAFTPFRPLTSGHTHSATRLLQDQSVCLLSITSIRPACASHPRFLRRRQRGDQHSGRLVHPRVCPSVRQSVPIASSHASSPDADGAVSRGRQQAVALRVHRQRNNRRRMGGKRLDHRRLYEVPVAHTACSIK
jgi:hypothetical protein